MAVISTVGQIPGEPLVASLAAKNIIQSMAAQGIKRYIFLAGLNLDAIGDDKSKANQAKSVWMRNNFPEAVTDKQKAYELLLKSTLDWTMIRLPWIELTDTRRRLTVSLTDCPGEVISTADLAVFVVEQISNITHVKKAPFVASL